MGHHLTDDKQFKSDRHPDLPVGKIILSFKDPHAQLGLWVTAMSYRAHDPELSADMIVALDKLGSAPPRAALEDAWAWSLARAEGLDPRDTVRAFVRIVEGERPKVHLVGSERVIQALQAVGRDLRNHRHQRALSPSVIEEDQLLDVVVHALTAESEVPQWSTMDDGRPDFVGFLEALRVERHWSATLHAEDKTGQAASDQRALLELTRHVNLVGNSLGYLPRQAVGERPQVYSFTTAPGRFVTSDDPEAIEDVRGFRDRADAAEQRFAEALAYDSNVGGDHGRRGQDWCCLCQHPIHPSATVVGTGDGSGGGEDGRFAHRRCYLVAQEAVQSALAEVVKGMDPDDLRDFRERAGAALSRNAPIAPATCAECGTMMTLVAWRNADGARRRRPQCPSCGGLLAATVHARGCPAFGPLAGDAECTCAGPGHAQEHSLAERLRRLAEDSIAHRPARDALREGDRATRVAPLVAILREAGALLRGTETGDGFLRAVADYTETGSLRAVADYVETLSLPVEMTDTYFVENLRKCADAIEALPARSTALDGDGPRTGGAGSAGGFTADSTSGSGVTFDRDGLRPTQYATQALLLKSAEFVATPHSSACSTSMKLDIVRPLVDEVRRLQAILDAKARPDFAGFLASVRAELHRFKAVKDGNFVDEETVLLLRRLLSTVAHIGNQLAFLSGVNPNPAFVGEEPDGC